VVRGKIGSQHRCYLDEINQRIIRRPIVAKMSMSPGAIEVPAVGTEVGGLSVVSLSASAHQARRQWSFGLAIPWRILPIWRTRVLFRMPTRYRSPYSADMPSC
jgi:hypothetical protein